MKHPTSSAPKSTPLPGHTRTMDITNVTARLEALYHEAAQLREAAEIQGGPGEHLFDNGLGWDGDLDHELCVIADGLGGATLILMDQGCHTHSKRFKTEDNALNVAMRLHDHAQGEHDSDYPPLDVHDVQWDT